MRCFMPDRQLEGLLGLEERLQRKIKQAARSIGIEGHIIPGSEVSDRSYTETREAIEAIRRGETGFLDETQAGMSVEEYRQQLREGLENPFLAEQIKKLAWGSGSGKAVEGAEPGFVFCAKVGDNPDPHFRYVNMADPDHPIVVADLLASLKHAYATPQTDRVLDEDTRRLAYQAWSAARQSVFEDVDVGHRSSQPSAGGAQGYARRRGTGAEEPPAGDGSGGCRPLVRHSERPIRRTGPKAGPLSPQRRRGRRRQGRWPSRSR